jgi:DNA helicase-2/ATP-dependent DNA helicase PcrA
VVGDEKQAIYRFQGASIQNFIGFQNIWNNMRVISLPENYRSHQHILDASFKMTENNYLKDENANLRIRLNANQEIKNPLELITTPDIQTENYYLVEKIKEIIKTDNTATIAIIVRRNIDVARIFDLLEANQIDASAERGANIFAHPLGKMFFSLIEFLADSTKTEALAETFAGGLWHLNFVEQAEYIKLIRSGKLVEVESKIPAISELKKEMGNSGVLSYLILSAEISGLTGVAGKMPLGAEVWRGIYALATDLIASNHIEDTRELIRSLISYRDSADKKIIKIK